MLVKTTGALLVKERQHRPKLLVMVLVLDKLPKVSTFTIPHYVAIYSVYKLNLLVMSKVQCPIQDINKQEKFFPGEHEKCIADFLVTAGEHVLDIRVVSE